MNGSVHPEEEHPVYLCLGSNIEPAENLRKAIDLLRQRTRLLKLSTCWETAAVGSNGPNFLNVGACILTGLSASELKEQILAPIERQLGRVRGADKYAPRIIDADITLFDGKVMDAEIWRRVYLVLIFAEMVPDLRNPETGESLPEVARRLREKNLAIAHPELKFTTD